MECMICNHNFSDYRTLGIHILKKHHITTKEYYDTYIRTDNEGICPVCGQETTFRGLKIGYLICCSSKCSNNYNQYKIKETKLVRYGSETYNNPDKTKQTCLNKYGVTNIFQTDVVCDKRIQAMKSDIVKEKRKQTNIERFGTENVFASEVIKQKIKETNLERYGVEYTSQNQDILNKIQATNLDKYGVICNLNIDEVKQKIKTKEVQDKRANSLRNKPKCSKLEQFFENNLISLGYKKNIDYYCQYRSEEYPFMCDFYLVKQRLYVEINGYWMHNNHPFDSSNLDDINTLNKWKEKSISSQQYKYAIHIWTKSDVEKRKYGSNLCFVELWNKNDIIRFIEKLKEENYI